MNKEEWWIRLLMITGKKLPQIRQLYQQKNHCFNEQLLLSLGFSKEQYHLFCHIDEQVLTKCLAWLDYSECYLITYLDDDYPHLLRHIASAPIALFVQGNPKNLNKPQLAMVGSRRYSYYGEAWASYFSQELAAAGLVITSGLAIGIDGLCHKGAIAAGGTTIAVLGSGLACLYPKSHVRLAQKIVENNGTLVSEFMPFYPPKAENFPRRNRIISGLSLGVLVIEAELRSGSLTTAKYALDQGREVFALPGPLDNPNSQGTHSLIQQGAMLVVQPSDIIENLNSSLHWLVTPVPERDERNKSESFDLPSDLSGSMLYQCLSYDPLPVDLIADKIMLPVTDVMIQLIDLELSGFVKVVSGGYVRSR